MKDNDALKKALEELDKIQNNEYETRMAELRLKHILDTRSVEEYGYEKGKKEEKIEIAKKLLKKSYLIEEIIEITGLTKEEIEKL